MQTKLGMWVAQIIMLALPVAPETIGLCVMQDPFTREQVFVVVVSLGTVALWCGNGVLSQYTGQMGIVAIIPMVAFFGFGLLSKVWALVNRPILQLLRPLVQTF